MIYPAITAGIFSLDFFLKKYIDKKYARKVKHPRLGGKICIEKFYNKGATLNLLAKHPKVMTAIHSVIMVFVAVVCHVSRRWTEQFIRPLYKASCCGLCAVSDRTEMVSANYF